MSTSGAGFSRMAAVVPPPIKQAPVPPSILGEEDISPAQSKWLRLKVLHLRDSQGRSYSWEFVERATKFRETDGVGVFAKVVAKGQPDRLLAIAQYRPPLRTFVVELPAGVIEQGESVEAVALRELKEETGYHGVVQHVTQEVCNDQGLTNSCLNFAFATVDAAAAENAHPQPEPELGETIQVLQLPLEGLADELLRLKTDNGWQIDSRLFAFALGLDFARNSSSSS